MPQLLTLYLQSGLRNSGRPSSFLCACTNEQETEDKYVPCCKVNAGSVPLRETKFLLDHTGYKTPTDDSPLETGKWFSYGESRREFPDFVSSYSFASDTPSSEGWKPKKEDYPDLWINPEDSVVLKLNAGEIVPSTAFPSRVTLRFPRITAVRLDKKPREVESLQQLWEIHDNLLIDRAGDNSEKTFESGAVRYDDTRALKERFWTEEKYLSAGTARKKKRPKTLHSVANVPESVSAESVAFDGAVFVPLEGTYRLADDSLEADEAKEEGWLEEARAIRDHGSVRALIKKHGGASMLAPDAKLLEQGALIIGGDRNDPRVVNFVETIEKARSKAQELKMKKKPTSTDQATLLFAQCNGVVRWTFLLSLLAKWRSCHGDKANQTKIKATTPDLLIPDPLDYLARPRCPSGDIIKELCRIHVQNPIKMRRLLHEVADGTNNNEAESNLSWQQLCKNSLDPSERWIVRCKYQTLWPYEEDRVVIQETAVYVDVFADPRAVSNDIAQVDPFEHAALLSVLPMLRLAGGFIETKLGGRVTHVLCGLRDDFRAITFEDARPEMFDDPERGKLILEAIRKSPLYPENCPDLVSPLWVREEVWKPQV